MWGFLARNDGENRFINGMSRAHQATTQKRKPDELLFNKELEERDAAIEAFLQDDNIDPSLMVGDNQIPVIPPQRIDVFYSPVNGTAEFQYRGVGTNPDTAHRHQAAALSNTPQRWLWQLA